MPRPFLVLVLLAAILFPVSVPAQTVDPKLATSLSVPSGPTLLTVTGLDEATFAGGSISFDRRGLAALGMTEFETSTIWTEGRHRYAGIMLADLLAELGLAGAPVTLRLHALNNYRVDLPASEVNEIAPLLAFYKDGAPMAVRDKGPVWMIYPYDSAAGFRSETIYSRSIWQLDRIEVLH